MGIQEKITKPRARKAAKPSLPNGAVFAMPLADFLALRPFIPNEPYRPYLLGVCIEPHESGAVAAATNGRQLGVRFSPEAVCTRRAAWRVPKELRLDKTKSATQQWVVGTDGDTHARLHLIKLRGTRDEPVTAERAAFAVPQAEMSFGSAIVDCGSHPFPDWRKVLPKADKTDTFRAFNGEYLKDFGKHLTLRGSNEGAPHIIQNGDPNFLGVLMPMRGDMRAQDWMKTLAEGIF